MRKHWQYLKYVLKHKWFVFVECLKLGIPLWIAIFHDWDKFMPGEWNAYVQYFYGDKIPHPKGVMIGVGSEMVPQMVVPEYVQAAFDVAWNDHQKRNRHHWQFRLLTPDKPRPNFGLMSMDGGMTHVTVSTMKGEDVAFVFCEEIPWFKPPYALEKRLEADLNNTPVALPMPDVYRREMLADWRGAGRAVGKPDTALWYKANAKNIVLHPDTRAWIEQQLGIDKTG